jgi:diamine N-acetyltransferase
LTIYSRFDIVQTGKFDFSMKEAKLSEVRPSKEGLKEGIKPNTLSVRGKQVGLGPWLDEYLDQWVQAIQDPQLSLWNEGAFLMSTRDKEAAHFEQTIKSGGVNFAIFALPEVKLIGLSGIMRVNLRDQNGVLGISIFDNDYWGKGYGTEAVKLTVDYAFRFLNLHTVQLTTGSFNERAMRAYRKAGFKPMGRWREAQQFAGKRYDEVYMDCLVSEFEPPKPGWFELPN